MQLKDQVAIVTGGASLRGIGWATAKRFADEGARVVILDIDAAAEQAARAIDPQHLGPACDVRDEAVCKWAVQQVLLVGKIDDAGKRRVADGIPLGRLAVPADIANACLFLVSDQSAYIAGAVLDVSGGMHIH